MEYTDRFGRTRTCLRKDLESMRASSDVSVAEDGDEETERRDGYSSEGEGEGQAAPVDARKEEQRKLWEEEEVELTNKKNVHYQDVLFSGKCERTF